jgi:N-acetylmuramoyl-L-alanine amidase
MEITDRPSPNFDARPGAVEMLVLHYTGMQSAAAAIDRLCDPAAKVSAHYVVDEDGAVWRLVAEDKRAWHAGVSCWRGKTDINALSIGIEIVNPGHEFGYRPFPEPQMAAVKELARGILARHPIPARNVVGHSDVAPLRKQDPGELFDWPRLACAGIGFWPDFRAIDSKTPPALVETQALLAQIGYGCPQTCALDAETAAVITAFQRHYRPSRVDGIADDETCRRIAALAQALQSP